MEGRGKGPEMRKLGEGIKESLYRGSGAQPDVSKVKEQKARNRIELKTSGCDHLNSGWRNNLAGMSHEI